MRQEEYVSLLAVREICTHGGMMIRAVLRFTRFLPAMCRAIEFPVDRQVRPPIRILRRQRFVDLNSEPRRLAWVHHAVGKRVGHAWSLRQCDCSRGFSGRTSLPEVVLAARREDVHDERVLYG